jgi:predicted phage terminase large subunit-like protein
MFLAVIDPKIKWLWQSAPTRYGKTEILALALLYLAVVKHLKIPVVAGTEEKANKIMEYVVSHVSDRPELYNNLLGADIQKIERLKIMVSKQGLRWSDGGWIYITSVESRALRKEGEKVVGEGGDVVVLEEAGLIKREEQFSKVVRMPEETKGWGKLIMSGNCIENSVFETAYNNPLYKKIKISLEQSIKEGRFTKKFLEEKKGQTTNKDWKRYYLVQFPDPSEYAYFKPQKYELLPFEMLYCGAVDLSLGEGKTELGVRMRSKTGLVVLGVSEEGQIYEVESLQENMGPDETIRTILNFPYEFHWFGVEVVQFQRYFLKVIDKKSKELGKYIPFMGLEQKRKKEERIESLEPLINTGQILFKGDNDLWESMQNYPDVEWMDALDALEMTWRLAKKVGIELGTIKRPESRPILAGKHYQLIDPSKFKQ